MSGAFSGDGQPAPVTDASDKWLLDGSPWNTLRSCHFVQACLAGWLVESGCLEPAKCFSSQLNFDSSWCFHGALLLTLVSRVPYPTCFFGDKRKSGESHPPQNRHRYGKPWKTNHLHFSRDPSSTAGAPSPGTCCDILDPVFWWITVDFLWDLSAVNWGCPDRGFQSALSSTLYRSSWQAQWGKWWKLSQCSHPNQWVVVSNSSLFSNPAMIQIDFRIFENWKSPTILPYSCCTTNSGTGTAALKWMDCAERCTK